MRYFAILNGLPLWWISTVVYMTPTDRGKFLLGVHTVYILPNPLGLRVAYLERLARCHLARQSTLRQGLIFIMRVRHRSSVAVIFLSFSPGSFSFALLAYQLNALLNFSLEDGYVIITSGSRAIMLILIAMTGISRLFFLRASTGMRR